MSRNLEHEIDLMKKDISRLDNEIMYLRALSESRTGLIDSINDFWQNQWPEIKQEVGTLKALQTEIGKLTTKLDTFETKLGEHSTSLWKLYLAVAMICAGGSSVGSQLLSMLFGG